MLLAVGLFLPVGVYDSLWSRYLQDRGASVLYTGLSLSAYGVPFVAFAALGGRLADRFGPVRSSVSALVFIVPIVALYGVLPTPGLVVGVAMLEAVAQAVAVPASQAAMVRACPPDRVGAGQGLAGAAGQLAAGFTALIAAPVYSRFGSEAVFGGTAVVIGTDRDRGDRAQRWAASSASRRGTMTKNQSTATPANIAAPPTANVA